MKIYLAGPMRGIPYFNHPAFKHAAMVLRAEGHSVFSPHEYDEFLHPGMKGMESGDTKLAEAQGFNLRQAMAMDTSYICLQAEAIALLPGWESSQGACIERNLGKMLGLKIIELEKEYPQCLMTSPKV